MVAVSVPEGKVFFPIFFFLKQLKNRHFPIGLEAKIPKNSLKVR